MRRPLVELLDLLGRRWQLRVVWELRGTEPLTFRELRAACDDVSPSVLSSRLDELRDAGLVEHDEGYVLTPMGRELFELFEPVRDWADRWAAAGSG